MSDPTAPATPAQSGEGGPTGDTSATVTGPGRGSGRTARRGWFGNSIVVTALAMLAAMIVGAVLIAIADEPTRAASHYFFSYPWDTFGRAWDAISSAYSALFEGAILNPNDLGSGNLTRILGPISETLVNATPLIMAGLSVALAFRAGLFNIGGQGQIIAAAATAGYIGFHFSMPPVVHLVVALLAGMAAGAVWGGIAGVLKARTGAHEVITTIMLNWVAFFGLQFLLGVRGFQRPPYGQAISNVVHGNARLPHLAGHDLRVHFGLILALLAAVAVAWLLDRSTLGFQLRAVGANQFAARTAGMSVARSYVLVMVIAGALAGLAGVSQILGTNPAVTQDIDAGIGFDAITVALLGRATPLGSVLAGLLFGALRAGGVAMQSRTGTPIDLVVVVQSLIVLFIAAPQLVRSLFRLRDVRGGVGQQMAKGWNG